MTLFQVVYLIYLSTPPPILKKKVVSLPELETLPQPEDN